MGMITYQPLQINAGDLLFNQKVIRGINLGGFLMEISDEEKNNAYKRVSDDLRDGGKIFGTDIVKEVTLD